MLEKYKQYNAAKFLLDDDFIHSELHPTDETDQYWEKVTAQCPELQSEIQTARDVLAWMNRSRQLEILTEADEETLWRRIEQANRKSLKTKKVFVAWSITGIAAAIALLIGLNRNLLFGTPEAGTDYLTLIESARQANTSRDTQLILSDENRLSLEGKESEISYDKQGEILVNSKKVEVEETERQTQLNTLIVPTGKRSLLQLSDGTKMWVNSDTKVVYPNVFSSNKREIYVEGEVCLEVVHNAKSPFVVKTKDTETTVLGTKFNVMAYPEDRFTDIVLVEGKVEVVSDKQKHVLEPNQLLRYAASEEIRIKKVDVSDHISWIDGYYKFTYLTLNDLFGKISRYYGIRVEWEPGLNSLTCSGKLDLKNEPGEVFDSLEKAAPIKVKKVNEVYQIQLK